MKIIDKNEIWPASIIILTAAAGAAVYRYLPERVATHWNAAGAVNGWSGRLAAVILMPLIMLAVEIILVVVPFLDPLKRNIEAFWRQYLWFRVAFLAGMALLQLVILANGLGYPVAVGSAVMLMMAAIFAFLARLLPRTKRNYTIGIRLPWTLESDRVWDETHRFGGKVFGILAFIAVLAALGRGPRVVWLFMAALFLSLMSITVYAYLRYKNERDGVPLP